MITPTDTLAEILFEGCDGVSVFDQIEDWFRDNGHRWKLAGLNVERSDPESVVVRLR